MKIDTQGFDLEVLVGAQGCLERERPYIIVELIFGPLYEGQATPTQLIQWLDERAYSPAGVFHEHYADDGPLAWCDMFFTPREHSLPFAPRYSSPASGVERADRLETICAERLKLIEQLSEEADARLTVIRQLEAELARDKIHAGSEDPTDAND